MSSFVAHSLVGFIFGTQQNSRTFREGVFVAFFFIILAGSPDIDYLINYLRGESMSIRYTHSIGYVFFIGLFALLFRNYFFKSLFLGIPILLFFIAPFSHLLLDYLVGVHGNPYLYPFSKEVFVSPLGILPSAGRIDVCNHYFWRNILIELAIFVPLVMFFTPKYRSIILRNKIMTLALLCLLCIGVFVGYNLAR